MSFHLSFYSSAPIEHFTDTEGNVCRFQTYLKSRGMYASRCIVYVVSTVISCAEPNVMKQGTGKLRAESASFENIFEDEGDMGPESAFEESNDGQQQINIQENCPEFTIQKDHQKLDIRNIDISYKLEKISKYTKLEYNDEDLIGSGSYAKVYKGELRGATVAIKK